MVDRISCCIPFCKRSRRRAGSDHADTEWICAKHWPLVPKATKQALRLTNRRIEKIVKRKPEYREYWKLPPGSPARISAVDMWARGKQAWEKCKTQAFEKSAGI